MCDLAEKTFSLTKEQFFVQKSGFEKQLSNNLGNSFRVN